MSILNGLGDEFTVKGLDGEGINDAKVDTLGLQLLGGLEGLVEGHTGGDNGNVILSTGQSSHDELKGHKVGDTR